MSVLVCAILVSWCRQQTCILNKPLDAAISLSASLHFLSFHRIYHHIFPPTFSPLFHNFPLSFRGLMHFTFAVVSLYSFVFLAPKGNQKKYKNPPTHTYTHHHMFMQLHRPHRTHTHAHKHTHCCNCRGNRLFECECVAHVRWNALRKKHEKRGKQEK